jgi:hypothetical protein
MFDFSHPASFGDSEYVLDPGTGEVVSGGGWGW